MIKVNEHFNHSKAYIAAIIETLKFPDVCHLQACEYVLYQWLI